MKKEMLYEIGNGWHSLVIEMEKELDAVGLPYLFTQIKEKFGSLRVYISPATIDGFVKNDDRVDELYRIIDKYEQMSKNICELCGKSPAKCDTTNGWAKHLCDECIKMRKEGKDIRQENVKNNI